MNDKPLKVVYIDDDPDDRFLFEAALAQAFQNASLTLFGDSVNAIDVLQKSGERYDVIFLDLNMPVKSGLDVLHELKDVIQKDGLRIVILTTSGSDANVRATYELGAVLYVQKPTDFDEFVRLLNGIGRNAFALPKPSSLQDFIFKN